jgi:uncharacterized protein YraI
VKRRQLLRAIGAAGTLAALWPARIGVAAESAVVASPDGLRLRDGAGTDAAVLDVLPAGATVSLSGPSVAGWAPVRVGALSGWVAEAYLGPAPDQGSATADGAALAPGRQAEVVDAVRVRGGPGTQDPVVGALAAGARVDLLGSSADAGWWRVAGPAIGYVSGAFLRSTGQPASRRAYDLDLAVPFHRQLNRIWCDPADLEMWREYRTGRAADSSQAFQQAAWDWELAHNAGFTLEEWDCSPYAVASAADHLMPGIGFDHFVYDDPVAATRTIAWLLANPSYREPSVATIWRGDHYVLVRGVRASADPFRDPAARILGLWVADPNQGRPSWLGRDRYVALDRWLDELLTPVTYRTPGSGVPGDVWQDKHVTIQRSFAPGPTARGRRNATPADYA